MTILGNRNSLIEDEFEDDKTIVPSVIKNKEDGISFKKSVILSTILHPTVIGAAWLIIFILALMGITFSVFDKPKPKVNDIEFVLVDNAKSQTPKNKHTKFRSDRNTRTGGIRNPKKPVSMPTAKATKKTVSHKASNASRSKSVSHNKAKATPQKVVKHSLFPKNLFKKAAKPKASSSGAKSNKVAKPHPPSARPSIKPPSTPRPTVRPTSPFRVPVPKGGSGSRYSTGPVGGNGTSSTGGSRYGHGSYGSGSGSGRYAPTPSLSPTGGRSGSSGSRLSKGSSGGYGGSGNPGGGGGAPGVDSYREPDFGPYMRDLQRRIKMNWDPPKGNESKRVVLLFRIAKNGRLLSIRVFKSSGLPNSDKAALNAVELTAPFRPLPAGFRGNSIDIQFTFDYNVFGATGYR